MSRRGKHLVIDALQWAIARLAPSHRREWAAALICEIQYIDRFSEALRFAVGGIGAVMFERMKAMNSVAILRLGAAAYAFFWGSIKLGFATFKLAPSGVASLPQWFGGDLSALNSAAQVWQLLAFYLSAIACYGAAYALIFSRFERLVFFLGAAFAANAFSAAALSASSYFSTAASGGLWSFGIVLEEFVALTTLMFASFAAWRMSLQRARCA